MRCRSDRHEDRKRGGILRGISAPSLVPGDSPHSQHFSSYILHKLHGGILRGLSASFLVLGLRIVKISLRLYILHKLHGGG